MKVMILIMDVGNLVCGSGIFDINWNLTMSDALVFKSLLFIGRDDVFAQKMGVSYHEVPTRPIVDNPSDLMRAYDVDWLYVYEFIPLNINMLTGKSIESHEVTLFKKSNDNVREVTEYATPAMFNCAVHYSH